MQATSRLLVLAAITALLAACGGGDADEPTQQTTIPVDCALNPGQCK